jgi:uncharacterized protein (DUF2062 family)
MLQYGPLGNEFVTVRLANQMPKRLIKRLIPHHDKVREHKHLQLFGKLLHDPNLWHLNRHSASGGFAVGLFMAYVPLPFQMVMAAAAAIIFRVNLPISVALVWITNPVTIPPMFLFAYLVGTWVIGTPPQAESFEFSLEWIESGGLSDVWLPLLVGSLICGSVASLLGYSLILWIWRWRAIEKWRMRRHRKKRKGNTPSTLE